MSSWWYWKTPGNLGGSAGMHPSCCHLFGLYHVKDNPPNRTNWTPLHIQVLWFNPRTCQNDWLITIGCHTEHVLHFTWIQVAINPHNSEQLCWPRLRRLNENGKIYFCHYHQSVGSRMGLGNCPVALILCVLLVLLSLSLNKPVCIEDTDPTLCIWV